MRFDRIDLIAFGPFTDFRIDLSAGDEGLHIVYGPNEAGKSSALRAITQFLYGIPNRTHDDFVHPYGQMRIGAALRSASGERLEAIRRKGAKQTLRDERDEAALDEAVIDHFTGGISQEVFEQMFGLGHERLVAGAKEILAGHGELGRTLFTATAGLAGVHTIIQELEAEADAVFLERGTKPALNAAVSDYGRLESAAKQAAVSAETWERLDRDLQETRREQERIGERRNAIRAERSRLQRTREALPRIAYRKELREALGAEEDALLLAEDFSERRRRVDRDLDVAKATLREASEALERLGREIEALCPDERLLQHGDIIEELDGKRSVVNKAVRDLERELEPGLRQAERDIADTMRQLNPAWAVADVEELRLTAAERARIHELCSKGRSAGERLDGARRAVEECTRRQDRLARQLDTLGPVEAPVELERALRAARAQESLEEQLNEAERARQVLEENLALAASRLAGWRGPWREVVARQVPSYETIEQHRNAHDQLAANLDRARETVEQLEKEQRALQTREADLVEVQGVIEESVLDRARAVRDRGWRAVRTAWEAGRPPKALDGEARAFLDAVDERLSDLADGYELAVERGDIAGDRLRREATRVAELEALRQRMEEGQVALSEQRSRAQAWEVELAARREVWNALWRAIGVEAQSPVEMQAWRRAWESMVNEAALLRDAQGKAEHLAASAVELRRRLAVCLERYGTAAEAEASLDALLACAERLLEGRLKAVRERERLELAKRSLAEETLPAAARELEEAGRALEAWRAEWTEITARLNLDAKASPAEVTAVIEALLALFERLDKAADLRQRMDAIEADRRGFEEGTGRLVQTIAPDLGALSASDAVRELTARLARARQAAAALEAHEKNRTGLERQRAAAEKKVRARTEDMEALCREAGGVCSDALDAAESRSARRRDLERRLAENEDQLRAFTGGLPVDDFVPLAEAEDPDTIGPRIEDLDAELQSRDQEYDRLTERIGALREELNRIDGGDRAAGIEMEAASRLAGIALLAEQCARTRLAAVVLRRAVERFRDAHQAPIIAQAGGIFAELTEGGFAGLRADYDPNGNSILVGVRSGSGGVVGVDAMSDGTADQLYLALRLAGVRRYLERGTPIPFICDDVLINFDDDRAKAALRALAGLSDRIQVIFFTHHRRLVELAERHVDRGRLSVHELPGVGVFREATDSP
ncbi:MAG TPA: AAA family ATPase [Candidatus Hydrogenedentes bacterium]|nr:AAA family ATPase [Candidatus Hydrogenedentota bacterium]HPG68715.1 AAA family ATPase [Candidatus Hydrogenedentota bacterium]